VWVLLVQASRHMVVVVALQGCADQHALWSCNSIKSR